MQLEHSILKRHCPHLAVIDVAARLAGRAVPPSDIALLGAPRRFKPTFTLQQAADLLNALNINGVALRTDLTGLAQLPLPVLVQMTAGPVEEFVVVHHLDEHAVIYYGGHQGWQLQGRDMFSRRWSGVCYAIDHVADEGRAPNGSSASLSDLELKLVQDFMTAEECAQLIDGATGSFQKSMVSGDGSLGSEIASSGRTSESTACSGDLCARIIQRAANLVGLASTSFEPLQCVRYEAGQRFAPHYDVPLDAGGPDYRARAWTLLVYLNDGFEGGETLFPVFDLRVSPVRGGLLMFRNRHALHGHVHGGALHAGLPVIRGMKYACNLWCSADE